MEGRALTHYLLAVAVLLPQRAGSGREGLHSASRSTSSSSLTPSVRVRPFHESRAVQPVMLFIHCGRSRSAFILVHSIPDAFLSHLDLSLDSFLILIHL